MILFCPYLDCLETLDEVFHVGGDCFVCDPHAREVAECRVRMEAVDDEFDGDRFILPYTGVPCQSHFRPDCPVLCNVLKISSCRQRGALGFLLYGQVCCRCGVGEVGFDFCDELPWCDIRLQIYRTY